MQQLLDKVQLGWHQAFKTMAMGPTRDRGDQFNTIAFYRNVFVAAYFEYRFMSVSSARKTCRHRGHGDLLVPLSNQPLAELPCPPYQSTLAVSA